jgi:TolB-like protein
MVERNAGLPPERRIEFRVGVHLGDVVEESDGDLMGDGVNIAARLEGIADPGGICLSEDAYRQVRDRLQDEFIDLGEKELKNIARPVRAYAIKTGSGGPASALHASAPDKTGPPRLSIVVLPFANLGGDPEQEYFVDGVTESLTTDLSRIAGSFVIGRNTAFTYKGKHVDLKQIGRELNVRYVLEGSVQRSGNRLRPARPAARAAGHRSAWPSAARARIRRRLHGEGAGRDRRPARTPHHRGVAPPLRRRAASAGGARLHRAALEGLLSNATSRSDHALGGRRPRKDRYRPDQQCLQGARQC